MTSRPLLARVAESIVIFAPIDHVGWRRASSGVTAARSLGPSRKGPPEAVRMSAATLVSDSPTRHCQIAECSESIGRSQASGLPNGSPGRSAATPAASSRASGMTRWPPATSVSLLAVATTLPAPRAAMTGPRLTTPPVPTTTRSTSARVASSVRASGPLYWPVPNGRWSAVPVAALSRATTAGRRRAAWSLRATALVPVARATMRKLSDSPSRTSIACRPIDPVEPRTATPSGRARSVDRGKDIERHDGSGEQERIDPVEDTAVTGDEVARILGTGGPLEHRFSEVPGLRRETQQRPEDETRRDWLAEADEERGHHRGAGDQAADEPGVRLRRRDVDEEARLSEALADEVGARVVGPHPENEKDDPASLGAEAGQWCGRRQSRSRRPKPDHETEQRHVDRAEDRREPGRQALARIGQGEGADGGQDGPDRDQDDAAALEDPRSSAGKDQPDGDDHTEDRDRRVAHPAKESEHLIRRQTRCRG